MSVEIVIIVPGIMGSELRDGTEVIWPGSPAELVLPYGKMAQLLKPDLVPTDVIRKLSISTQYGALISALETCGFREQDMPPTLFVCPYDWRKDNGEAADRLAALIEHIRDVHGGDVAINLIAHSLGGLVSRYYLESGRYTTYKGFDLVHRLVTLGTPHRGAPLALLAALGLIKRLFLNEDQVERIASDPRYPSLYQLLPPPSEPFAWNEDPDARFLPVDIYNPEVAKRLNLSTENLQAAKQFHSSLDLQRRPDHVAYFFFAGTQQVTISEVRVRLPDSGSAKVRREERENSGDGTVPIWSAMQAGIQTAPVGGEHGTIYKGAFLQRVLSALLGKPGVLAATLPPAELAMRDPVVNPGVDTRAVLTLEAAAGTIHGSLRVVRYVDSAGQPLASPATVASLDFSYEGAGVDLLSIQLKAPDTAGIYRVEFIPEGEDTAVAMDELIVQKD